MCITALPNHLDSKEEIENNFPDDSQFGDNWFGRAWKRFKKISKYYFVFGYRDIHWYHRFRRNPMTLLALFGEGESRWENDFMNIRSINKPIFLYAPSDQQFYLSRVQYWCDWHIQLAWPLFFSCHFGKWQFYCGFKRDADGVYWVSLFIGAKWK